MEENLIIAFARFEENQREVEVIVLVYIAVLGLSE